MLAPCFWKERYLSVDEYLLRDSERVFVGGRVLAPCAGEGIRP